MQELPEAPRQTFLRELPKQWLINEAMTKSSGAKGDKRAAAVVLAVGSLRHLQKEM